MITEFGPTKLRKFGDIASYKELPLWDMILEIEHLNLTFNNVSLNVTKMMIVLDSTSEHYQMTVG